MFKSKPKTHKLHLESNTYDHTKSQIKPRFAKSTLVRIFVSLIFLVLIIVTGSVQLSSGTQSLVVAESNLGTNTHIQVPRGLIYDRNERKLVTNSESFSLYLSKKYYEANPDKLSDIANIIAKHVGISAADIMSKIKDSSKEDVIIARGLSTAQSLILKDELQNKRYQLVTDSQRDYLYPYLFSHIIGYTGIPNAEEVKAGYDVDELIGKYRLEKILDKQLRGTPGLEVKQNGSVVANLPGTPGDNVFLTIDTNWQQALYNAIGNQVDALNAKSGSAVIVDTATGDIWAYVSYPTFDPNIFSGPVDAATYDKLLKDPKTPLLDKVIGLQASPGSVFKLVAAYAGTLNGIIDASTHIFSNRCISLGGHPFCEYGKYFFGDLDLRRALARSSNIFFCEQTLKLRDQYGYDRYVDAAKSLGIGQKTGIILENELSGILPTPENKLKLQGVGGWYDGDICNSVIGQGITNVTPLQMAMLFATIYNGGTYYVPNLISKIEDQSGNVLQNENDFRKVARTIPINAAGRDLILAGMYNAVMTPEGTAYRFLHRAPGNFIAKTGSAEAYEVVAGQVIPKVNGWIVGKFDYSGKTFAFAAQMQFAGGGWNVTQVMQRFANCLFNNFSLGCQNI
jgi:penicillin-binding protein 2